jgi:ketosteroid isomerase-like protein/uncharacterized protein YciI
MSSPGKQPEHQGMPPRMRSEVGPQKTYAFVYAPGPQWLVGRPRTEQNLGAHRAYIADLHARGRALFGGAFLDDARGGFGVVRAKDRDEALALLAADLAIEEGVFTGEVRRWQAVFDEAEDLRAASLQARLNKCTVEALFEAVDRRDGEGVRAAYAENITIHETASLPYGGHYRGALHHGQGFRAAWDRFQRRQARGLDPRIIGDSDHVVVLWQHKVENPETDDRLDRPAVIVYRMENAKIADSRTFYFDAAALLRFLERNDERPASQLPQRVS